MSQVSIIIPVYNQWAKTSVCLRSIALHTDISEIDVIIIDNGSSDETKECCSVLGHELFGSKFSYIRNERNTNFAHASNQGAHHAKTPYLCFLNNDTEVCENWLPPLLRDFSEFPKIAATGPVLVYPKDPDFGHIVQHLGIYVGMVDFIDHLYKYISVDCPLAKKRRFFQAITAACMLIKKNLFFTLGLFNEQYVNSLEDVDLCARSTHMGLKCTINPVSRVIHHESTTEGRHDNEDRNEQIFNSTTRKYYTPDLLNFVEDDGLNLVLSPWLIFTIRDKNIYTNDTKDIFSNATCQDLLTFLQMHPYFEEGWVLLHYKAILNDLPILSERALLYRKLFFPSPAAELEYTVQLIKNKNPEYLNRLFRLKEYFYPWEDYREVAKIKRKSNNIFVKNEYFKWEENEKAYYTQEYLPSIKSSYAFLSKLIPLSPHDTAEYTLWRMGTRKTPEKRFFEKFVFFSVIMPVYNTNHTYLREAIESVINQTWKIWELCIVDDGSTDEGIRKILDKYMHLDTRIHVLYREKNENIAAATNIGIEHAQYPWIVFMDSDDTLTSDALYVFACKISKNPNALLFYSDEDKLRYTGAKFFPYFKNSRWDPFLILEQNFVNHLCVMSRKRILEVGKLDPESSGVQDHDLLLRYTHDLSDSQILHIPEICYHWRYNETSVSQTEANKKNIQNKAQMYVQKFLDNCIPGSYAVASGIYLHIRYPLPKTMPLVTVFLDCRNFESLESAKQNLPKIFQSILSYEKLEFFILIDPKSDEDAREYCEYQAKRTRKSQILYCDQVFPITEILYKEKGKIHGKFTAILDQNCVPDDMNWIEILLPYLYQNNSVCVGSKIVVNDTELLNAGFMTDARKMLAPILCGASEDGNAWFAWNKLTRTVDAVSPLCALFESKSFFEMRHNEFLSFCVNIRKSGKRTVWCADTIFRTSKHIPFETLPCDLEPINVNLENRNGNFWNLVCTN